MKDGTAKRVLLRLIANRPVRQALRLLESCKHADHRVWLSEWGNSAVRESLRAGRPQAVGKLGSTELQALRSHLRWRHDDRAAGQTRANRELLFLASGVFPDDYGTLERFSRLMTREVLPAMDIMGVWFNLGEARLLRTYCRQAVRVNIMSLSPFLWREPWTEALAGRRVLVIHPFDQTIRSQYARREEIWPGRPHVLPNFSLDCLRVPQLPVLEAPSHESWLEALREMKDRMAATDFDIALIGAGAYSLPLAVHAKTLGRQAVHTGGETQFLFGIKGQRWDRTIGRRFYGPAWVRPLLAETPANAGAVEGGCYW